MTGTDERGWLAMWAVIGRPPYVANYTSGSPKIAWPDFRERRLWLVASSFGLGAVALGVVLYFSPLYLNRALGLSQAQLGKVLWIPLVGWEAGYYFWGWIADRYVPPGKRPAGLFCLLTVFALPTGLITLTQFLERRAGADVLGDVCRRRLYRAFAARRLALVPARSDGAGRRDRIRLLVRGARRRRSWSTDAGST